MIIFNRDSFRYYANSLALVAEADDLIGSGIKLECGI